MFFFLLFLHLPSTCISIDKIWVHILSFHAAFTEYVIFLYPTASNENFCFSLWIFITEVRGLWKEKSLSSVIVKYNTKIEPPRIDYKCLRKKKSPWTHLIFFPFILKPQPSRIVRKNSSQFPQKLLPQKVIEGNRHPKQPEIWSFAQASTGKLLLNKFPLWTAVANLEC